MAAGWVSHLLSTSLTSLLKWPFSPEEGMHGWVCRGQEGDQACQGLVPTPNLEQAPDTGIQVLPLPEGCILGHSPAESSPGRAVCAVLPLASGRWRDGLAGSLAARAPLVSRRASGCWCQTPHWTAQSPLEWGGTGAACWAYPRLWWFHQSSRDAGVGGGVNKEIEGEDREIRTITRSYHGCISTDGW